MVYCLKRLQDSERRFITSGNYRIFKDNTLYQFWRRAPGIVLVGRPVANRFFKPHQTMLKFPSVGDAQWERFLRDTRRKFERCITFMGPSGPVWPVSEDLTIDRDAEDLALQLGWITRAGILHMCWSFNWLEVSADCPLTWSNTDMCWKATCRYCQGRISMSTFGWPTDLMRSTTSQITMDRFKEAQWRINVEVSRETTSGGWFMNHAGSGLGPGCSPIGSSFAMAEITWRRDWHLCGSAQTFSKS